MYSGREGSLISLYSCRAEKEKPQNKKISSSDVISQRQILRAGNIKGKIPVSILKYIKASTINITGR